MKQATTIRLSEELHKQLKDEANKRGMTLNAYIISILWQSEKTKKLCHPNNKKN